MIRSLSAAEPRLHATDNVNVKDESIIEVQSSEKDESGTSPNCVLPVVWSRTISPIYFCLLKSFSPLDVLLFNFICTFLLPVMLT